MEKLARSANLDKIYRPVRKELSQVEDVLQTVLTDTALNPSLDITDYLIGTGGKRLRPALAILSAKAGNKSFTVSKQTLGAAAAMELIHRASLVHDDVIDHADVRHNRPTINSKWGNEISIVWGDNLYCTAFNLITICNNIDILQNVIAATRAMCEGEIIQIYERNNPSLLKERYMSIIEKKTAALFEVACYSGAVLSGSGKKDCSALKEYGRNLGIGYQIIDDCMDIVGTNEALGKSPGVDFSKGELTLPLFHLISRARNRGNIIKLMHRRDHAGAFKEIKKHFSGSPALDDTKNEALHFMQKARECLKPLSDSPSRQSLIDLSYYLPNKLHLITPLKGNEV